MTADRLHALVKKWRGEYVMIQNFHATMGTGYQACADELEAALLAAPLPQPEGWQPPNVGLSANDVYWVMQQWEKMPASLEQTRVVIALGKLRDLYIKRGDSPFVSPLPPAPLVTDKEP